MKCVLCGKKLEETFLKKPLGTLIKDDKGKKYWICRDCQKGKNKEELLASIERI